MSLQVLVGFYVDRYLLVGYECVPFAHEHAFQRDTGQATTVRVRWPSAAQTHHCGDCIAAPQPLSAVLFVSACVSIPFVASSPKGTPWRLALLPGGTCLHYGRGELFPCAPLCAHCPSFFGAKPTRSSVQGSEDLRSLQCHCSFRQHPESNRDHLLQVLIITRPLSVSFVIC